jgi:hypothetical protein
MKRRAFLQASLTSLALPATSHAEATTVHRTGDIATRSSSSVTLPEMGLDAEADDLSGMYSPQLIAVIEVVNVMVARQETTDPESDVVLTFSRWEDAGRVVRHVGRIVLPVRNLRAGLYVRGSVRYRLRLGTPVPSLGIRSSVSFARAARVRVFTDEMYGAQGTKRPVWTGNTVIVASPAVGNDGKQGTDICELRSNA